MDGVDLEKTWDSVLAAIRVGVSEASYNTYLKQTSLERILTQEKKWVGEVSCTSAFVKDTVEKRYGGQLGAELSRVTGRECEVALKVSGGPSRVLGDLGPLFEEGKKTPMSGEWKKARLKEDYTFENYAVGGSNQMAYAAAQAVSKKPGLAYNPLFIYGGVGVGKTHLMQAIGHEVMRGGETAVLCCSGEEFTNDLVEAIRYKNTDKVRLKYRQVKLLLIDDVQFIAGKPSVQEEFFHTFNALQREGGQVVMTSDKPPGEISKLEERLKSRFGAGLTVDIGQPDFELRAAILLIKAKQRGIELEMGVAQIIANHIEGVRELQGFLTRLVTEAEVNKREITQDYVREMLKITNGLAVARRVITPSEIMATVGEYYGVGVQQLKGERRTKTVAWPRQVVMYLLTNELRLPLEEVGRLLGGRDHTTIMHGRDKVIEELGANERFKSEFGEVKRRIFSG